MIVNPRPLTLPRDRRKPSPRNMQIYEEVRLSGQRQAEVAARHGLNQQRVSQICQQVDRWRQWAAASPDYEAIEAEQRRQRLLAARKRHEQVLLLALRQAVQPSQSLVTERRVTDKHGTSVSRTEKVIPTSAAWAGLVFKASSSVAQLSEKLGVDVESNFLAEEIDRLLAQVMTAEASEEEEPNEGSNSSTSSEVKSESSSTERGGGEALNSLTDLAASTCGEMSGCGEEV
ncbi:MAG: hypothetical protein L0211_17320 [Planctomycetaceae bacterium]|nr:hypothetical protein [Planctomycetaceae bacterium]